jgi:hypothetical protein
MNLPLQMGAVSRYATLLFPHSRFYGSNRVGPSGSCYWIGECTSTQTCCTCAGNNTEYACCGSGESCQCNNNTPSCGT